MQTLKAGDVRQKGDKVRKTGKGPDHEYHKTFTGDGPHLWNWQSVSLIGHTILSSDLMVAEFCRP